MQGGAAGPRRRVLIIANPAAGRSWSARRRLARVVAGLERRGCQVAVRPAGRAVGDAERLAREAEPDFDIVVAAGGDGTLNAVVNGLAGTSRPVALLPFGTANVAAHDIGLPRGADQLAELIATGAVRPIWPGRAGDRLFVAMAGCGFDAAAVAAVDPRIKRLFGRLAFAWAIALCLLRYCDCPLIVRADGVDHPAAAVIAAKGRCYAGRYVIAPQGDLSAPSLDLVLFQHSGRIAVLRYLGALLLGRLAQHRDVVRVRCRHAQVSSSEPVGVQVDGEPLGHLPVTLGVAERPLAFVRP